MGGVWWTTGRELLRNTLFPVLLFGGVALAVGLRELGAGELVAVVASTFSVAIALLFFQEVLPFEPTCRGTPSDFGIDFAHLISTGLAGELWRAMVFGLVIQGSVVLVGWWGGSLWPSHLPWLLQVGLALLIGDLGAYWAHRHHP